MNLSGAFHTMRRALPGMGRRGHGRVINIASVHGLVASVNKAPYVSAKFGLIGLSRVSARIRDGGRARQRRGDCQLHLPRLDRDSNYRAADRERAAEFGRDRVAGIASLLEEKQPSRRTSRPEEIGALALWLANPLAHNITGAAIPIDGGWTAQ